VKAPSEEVEQENIAMFLDLKIGKHSWCHVPNGGLRNKVVAAKLMRQGVKPGVPDVLIFKCSKKVTAAKFRGVAIEMKRVNMSPSDLKANQSAWLESLDKMGWLTHVAKGCGDAIDFLTKWGY
jgi:hypothetical protein